MNHIFENMKFKMDSQSFNDLNIFSVNDLYYSVIGLFKQVKVNGSREKLEEMMRNPSSDINFLQERRDAIEFFRRSNLNLEIDHDQFDLITTYISHEKGFLRDNIIDSVLAYLGNEFESNQNYYLVRIGLARLLSLINYTHELIPLLIQQNTSTYLKNVGLKLQTILDQPAMQYASTMCVKKRIPYYYLGTLDNIIRRKNTFLVIEMLHVFYELDVLETIAVVAKNRSFCLPEYHEKEEVSVEIEGLFHPALADPIKNDIVIDCSNNVMFLSGSNMSGKSSFLKSIGTAIYLSHIGFPVPATKFRTAIFNGLITTINLSDNIGNGLSHYFSEVLRAKHVAHELIETDRLFVIFDELFKGTNSKDAFDGSLLLMEGLSEIFNSIFIISSHITGLTSELKKNNIQFQYFEHLMSNDKPVFTYRLKEGVSRDGIGMFFLKQEKLKWLLEKAANNYRFRR